MLDESLGQPQLVLLHWPFTRETVLLSASSDREGRSHVAAIIVDLLLACSNLFGLHGSAVSYGDTGLVFTGRSGAGKTSLTVASLRLGAAFLSDDICVISSQGSILPYEHKEMRLRQSTVAYLRRCGLLEAMSEETCQEYPLNSEMFRYASDFTSLKSYGSTARLRAIVLPHYTVGSHDAHITQLDAVNAEFHLRHSTDVLPWLIQWADAFEIPDKRAAVWADIRRLLRTEGVRVMQLEYGTDLQDAAHTIAEHVLRDCRG